MNKIKKSLLYLTGMLMALVFKIPGASAQILYGPPMDMYGPPETLYGPPISNTNIFNILGYLLIFVLIPLAIIIGIVVLVKRKKKNAKKTL